MRLAAEVTDRFSAPIRDMTRQLSALNKLAQQQQKEGTIGAKEHIKWFRELHQTTHKLSDEVKGVLTPAMAAFGVGSLSVAGAIAAITKSVADFGGAARNLSNLSHFSGLTVQDVRVYEELAAALGSSKTEMDGFITSFSTNIDQWRRLGRGPMADFFATQPAEIRNIGIALRHTADNAQALNQVFDFLADTRYTAVQKKILTDAIGMPAAFAHAGAGARELYAKLNAEVKPLDKGWEERKQRYLESMALLSASWSNLSLHIGDAMSPGFARAGESLRGFLDKHDKEIEKFAVDAEHWLEGVNWAAFAKGVEDVAKDIGDAARAVNTLVENTAGWKPVLEFLLVYKAANILGLTTAVRGLAGSFGLLSAVTLPAWMVALMAGTGAYRLATAPGESLGVTGPRSVGGNLKELWNMATGQKPPEPASGPAAAPAPAEPPKQSWSDWLKSWQGSLAHKESFAGFESEGPNPLRAAQSALRFPAEETLGAGGAGSTSDAINTIAIGTRKGVYDGMVDYYQYLRGMSGAGVAAGETGGLTRASFGLDGQGSSPAGTGRAGGLGGTGAVGEGLGAGLGGGAGEDNVRPGQGRGKEPETEATADFWRRHGYPESAVAGIIGNLKHETGGGDLNPNDVNRAEGAIGKYQDRLERAEGLKAWAAKQRKDWRDPRMQDEYALHELETNPKFGGLRRQLMDPNVSPEAKATAWNRTFEGSADRSGGRERTARAFYDSTKALQRSAPHFTLDQIRRQLGGGSVGDQIRETLGGDTRGRANFMRGQFGAPGTNLTKITTAGGHSLTVNRESAPYFKGFLEELEKGGAPIHQSALGGYNFRNKVGASGLSQHAYGNAIDVNQLGRNVTTGDFAKWVQSHRDEFNAAERKWHMYGGERFNDFGHFEWGGVPFGDKQKVPEIAALHGAALREHFGHRGRHAAGGLSPGDLLKSAQRVGMAGAMQHTVKGDARLQVDFNGLPRGTLTKIEGDGMFTQLALNRGRTPRADQEA
jgi:hypothetical protein